jgi:HEAT repeat protein
MLTSKLKVGDDALASCGKAFTEMGDWKQARRLFIKTAKDQSASREQRIEAIQQLGRLGFRELGLKLINEIEADALIDPHLACGHSGSIAALCSLKQNEAAVAVVQKMMQNETDGLWKLEAIDTLGTKGPCDSALNLLEPLLNGDSLPELCRAAEILFDLKKPAKAFGLMSRLLEKHKTNSFSADDCLGLADTLLHVGWIYSARSLVEQTRSDNIAPYSRRRLDDLREYLREAV